MLISCIECPTCRDKVFSRARHDCRSCSCGEVYIDGGLEGYYQRVGFKEIPPNRVDVEVDTYKADLYFDWCDDENKFGVITPLGSFYN